MTDNFQQFAKLFIYLLKYHIYDIMSPIMLDAKS